MKCVYLKFRNSMYFSNGVCHTACARRDISSSSQIVAGLTVPNISKSRTQTEYR